MSKTTKKKHVTRETIETEFLPQNGQFIAKVTGGRGSNLHEVLDQHGVTMIVSMPTKFRKTVWIKRDGYVLVDPIAEGDKVKGEINAVLLDHNVQILREKNLWPEVFDNDRLKAAADDLEAMMPPVVDSDEDQCSEDEENHLVNYNPNRRQLLPQEEDDSDNDD